MESAPDNDSGPAPRWSDRSSRGRTGGPPGPLRHGDHLPAHIRADRAAAIRSNGCARWRRSPGRNRPGPRRDRHRPWHRRQQVVSAGGTCRGLGVGEMPRGHQPQLVQAHVLHGPRHRADVARMSGVHQDHADVLQRTRRPWNRVAREYKASNYSRRAFPLSRLPVFSRAMQPMTNIAIRAARDAGRVLLRYFDRVDSLNDRHKAAQRLRQRSRPRGRSGHHRHHPQGLSRPRHPRRGKRQPQRQRLPVDHRSAGRHHQLSARLSRSSRCPSRCKHRDDLQSAVVYDPLREEMFTASRGSGAYLDDRRIRVSARKGLDGALSAPAFPSAT